MDRKDIEFLKKAILTTQAELLKMEERLKKAEYEIKYLKTNPIF